MTSTYEPQTQNNQWSAPPVSNSFHAGAPYGQPVPPFQAGGGWNSPGQGPNAPRGNSGLVGSIAAIVAVAVLAAGAFFLVHSATHHSASPAPVTGSQPVVPAGQAGSSTFGAGGILSSAGTTPQSGTGGTSGPTGAGGTTGTSGGTTTTWPAAFAGFTDLIGTGPGSHATWNGATCAKTAPSSDTDLLSQVTCREPDGTVVDVEQYKPGVVASVVSGAQSDSTAKVTNWNNEAGTVMGKKIVTTAGGVADIMSTFAAYPNVMVQMLNKDAALLQTDWLAVPFPS